MRTVRMAPAALLLAAIALALDTSKLQPRGYVNDFAGVLDPSSAHALESYCGNLERATGAQMAIVTVKSLADEPIEDAANRLFQQWGIGKKGTDEGILLMLAIQDRKQRAEVGYGLEPVITDGYAGSVLRGIRPILRQGNYGGALLAAAQEFGSRIAESKGVALPGEQAPRAASPAPVQDGGSIWGILVAIILFGLFLRLISGGRGGGGSGTGFLGGLLLGNVLGRRRDGYGGFGGGGFGGYDSGWSAGGGGFGGFGGGASGGGGASSGW